MFGWGSKFKVYPFGFTILWLPPSIVCRMEKFVMESERLFRFVLM